MSLEDFAPGFQVLLESTAKIYQTLPVPLKESCRCFHPTFYCIMSDDEAESSSLKFDTKLAPKVLVTGLIQLAIHLCDDLFKHVMLLLTCSPSSICICTYMHIYIYINHCNHKSYDRT